MTMADKKEEQTEESRRERERLAAEANRKRNDEQLDRRNAIADSADEVRAADFEDFNPDETKDESTDEGEESEEEVVKEAQKVDRELDEARDAGADDIRVTDGVTQYRTVVNGKERWQTLPELRATAQKVESADEYLREASESVRKAAQLQPSVEERRVQADEEAKARRTRLRETLSRAVMGDDEALDALAQSIDEGPSRVTPDVLQLVDQRVDGRMTFRQAAAWFDTEYAEELKSPRLKQYIVTRDSQMAAEHPEMNFRDRLKAVGDEVREMRKELGGSVTQVSTKQARKEAAPQVPSSAATRTREAPADEEEGYESAIDRMAKSRGQPRAHKH
jgi:hypothetical protein